jgi:transposase
MAPELVTPYRMSGKRGKNDAADAAAICEAMPRPNMRLLPIKTEDRARPQAVAAALHRRHPTGSARSACAAL